MRIPFVIVIVFVVGCAISHEITVDANVDGGGPGAFDVLSPCHASESGSTRDCGWFDSGSLSCRAGERVSVGCGAVCGLGTCTNDAMIRVCDSVPCRSGDPAYIGSDDDSCGSLCPRVELFRCPASGTLRVLTAPFVTGNPYTCSFVVR